MSQDDPFAPQGTDRTVMVPSPGARGAGQARVPPPVRTMTPAWEERSAVISGMNPLLAAANALLAMVPRLRGTLHHPDPQSLRESLARDIKEFERRAQAAHIPNQKIIAARYALCTLLDETASSTPWGGSGMWQQYSLLIMFHNEASGGEKFFQLLSKLAENPAENLDLLQLMDVCLALGFEGRYRMLDNGKAQLEAVRERLTQILRRTQGEYERDLSPHWLPATGKRHSALFAVPIWVTLAVLGLVLLGIYAGFSYLLNTASDPVFAGIQAIRVKTAPAAPPKPASEARLAKFLAKEIAEGLVAVRDEDARSVVTIRGDGLFAPGSATIAAAYEPLIARIATALNSVAGQVVVSGHTDNQSIRTARFPSNWHLSQERAHSVAQMLSATVAPARITAEGRAETEPIAKNDTVEGRSRNRRVEVTLVLSRGADAPK